MFSQIKEYISRAHIVSGIWQASGGIWRHLGADCVQQNAIYRQKLRERPFRMHGRGPTLTIADSLQQPNVGVARASVSNLTLTRTNAARTPTAKSCLGNEFEQVSCFVEQGALHS